MFLTRKFSIFCCQITDNTPNYCVKDPVVHLSLCWRPSDTPMTISNTAVKSSRFMWVYICMYMYVYICVHVLQVYYTYAYTHINFDDSTSK